MSVFFVVYGNPVPQGSKRHVGGGVMVEMGKNLQPWRQEIAAAGVAAMKTGVWRGTPVHVQLSFFLMRPKGHFGTGRNEGTLRPSAPRRPAVKPDIDKLVRAVLDALTGVVFADDSQVVTLTAEKQYADAYNSHGVHVSVSPAA